MDCCSYKPGYVKDCRPLPEGRNKAGRDLPRLYRGARSPRTAVRQEGIYPDFTEEQRSPRTAVRQHR